MFPSRTRFVVVALIASLILVTNVLAAENPGWKAGVAKVVITPQESMWMAGYAARKKPSEGKVQDLFAKALAMEDTSGTRLVIVTTDLIGIPRDLREWLVGEVQAKYQLPASGLLLNASHTHCGPELRTARALSAGLPPERLEQSQNYYDRLREQLSKLIGDALGNLGPATLSYTHGRAGFAMNRRLPTGKSYNNAPYPDGPVDHDVPVLRVAGEDGQLRALLFGYACHNTTLSFFQFCGDYAGYAQEYLEENHPGATALFLTGCGGDQNPQPRGALEQAQQHGRALANGVEAALLGPSKPIRGPLRLAIDSIPIEFADPPSRDELTRLSKSSDTYDQRRAATLLKELDEKGEIHKTYPYWIQGVRWGDDLLLVALAGEVVVDYSLRLKHELAGPCPVWIAGYSNDVFGYVPSLRVLQEGGYEAGGAMRFTSHPGPFAPTIEKLIVSGVHAVVGKLNHPSTN
jgi:hypothetical protein